MLTGLTSRHTVHPETMGAFFVEGNLHPTFPAKETLSPSGRYRLQVRVYATGENTWSYSRGEVFRVSDGAKVADVKRNYVTFPHLFVEDHAVTGHDYLIASEDYQGHTVVDLTASEIMSFLPEDAAEGHGWCPTSFELLADRKTLKVEGCYWACPYQIQIWDFSDPTREGGLPDLTEGLWIDEEAHASLTVAENGDLVWSLDALRFKETGEWANNLSWRDEELSKAHHVAQRSGDEAAKTAAWETWTSALHAHQARYNEEDASLWERVLDHRRAFRREGERYVEVKAEEYKSPRLLAEEAAHEARKAREKAKIQAAREACWIHACARLEWPDLPSRERQWYPSVASRWDGEKNDFYFTVRVGQGGGSKDRPKRTSAIEWGAQTGAVSAVLWTYGKGEEKTAFSRSPEGFSQAVKLAHEHLEGA